MHRCHAAELSMLAILKSVLHPHAPHRAKPTAPAHAVPNQEAIETPAVRDALSGVRNESAREIPVFPARSRHERDIPVLPARSRHERPATSETGPIQWIARPSSGEVAHAPFLRADEADTSAVGWEWAAPLPGPSQRIDGSGIEVSGSDVPADLRAELERKYGVTVRPLVIAGREIGYRLEGDITPSDTVMVSCHGDGVGQGVFSKPADVEFRFAAPRNMVLDSATRRYALLLTNRAPFDHDDSQVYGADVKYAVDYQLSGGIHTTAAMAAEFLHRMREAGTPLPFDVALVNGHADGVRFSHLTLALQDSLQGKLRTLICHFCRPQDDRPRVFHALRQP